MNEQLRPGVVVTTILRDWLQAYYFDRSDVALSGLYQYFKKASDEERSHADKLLIYQNKRGGNLEFTDIQAPPKSIWNSAKEAMTEALKLERNVNQVRYRSQRSTSLRIAFYYLKNYLYRSLSAEQGWINFFKFKVNYSNANRWKRHSFIHNLLSTYMYCRSLKSRK